MIFVEKVGEVTASVEISVSELREVFNKNTKDKFSLGMQKYLSRFIGLTEAEEELDCFFVRGKLEGKDVLLGRVFMTVEGDKLVPLNFHMEPNFTRHQDGSIDLHSFSFVPNDTKGKDL